MFVLLSGLLAAAASGLLLSHFLGTPRAARQAPSLHVIPLTPWTGIGATRRVCRFRLQSRDPDLAISGLQAHVEAFGLDALPRPSLRAAVRLGFGDDLPLQAVRQLAGSELLVELDLAGESLDRRGLHAATIDLQWQTYGRTGWLSGGTTLVVPLGHPTKPLLPMAIPSGTVLALPTRLVVPGDDLAAIIAGITAGRTRPGDCLAISESALAIAQDRLVWPRWASSPGTWARGLSKLFPVASSLATAHGMQAAISEAGLPRLLLAILLGGLAKLFRIPGVFYRLAGWRVAVIDDVGGNLTPFDRAIVLAPRAPEAFVNEIARRCGTQAAVVDANALGVRVLAATPGVDLERLKLALAANPHGNGIERTPVVRVRWADSPSDESPREREGATC